MKHHSDITNGSFDDRHKMISLFARACTLLESLVAKPTIVGILAGLDSVVCHRNWQWRKTIKTLLCCCVLCLIWYKAQRKLVASGFVVQMTEIWKLTLAQGCLLGGPGEVCDARVALIAVDVEEANDLVAQWLKPFHLISSQNIFQLNNSNQESTVFNWLNLTNWKDSTTNWLPNICMVRLLSESTFFNCFKRCINWTIFNPNCWCPDICSSTSSWMTNATSFFPH